MVDKNRDIMETYYIGGSSCAGKSTAAHYLAQKYGLCYFGVDDHLGSLAEYGIRKGFPMCVKHSRLSMDEFLMRQPDLQCRELMEFYNELHERIMQMVMELNAACPVIAEGIAFMPGIMQRHGISPDRYICMCVSGEYQVEHYKARNWTKLFLEGCKDKEAAFRNWMEREEKFTEEIRRQASENGYRVLEIPDEKNAEGAVHELEDHFRLQFRR